MNTDTDADTNRNGNRHTYCYRHSYCYCYAYRDGNSDASDDSKPQTSPDSGAAAVILQDSF